MDRTILRSLDLSMKVRFLGDLRDVVGRRTPVNKVGSRMISDFDLIASSDEEIAEALGKQGFIASLATAKTREIR